MSANPEPMLEEILSSDKIGGYLAVSAGVSTLSLPDNPTWIWEQLRTNPWLSMAIYDDLEEKDAKVGSDLESRKEAVLALSRRVLPSSDKRQDTKLAAWVEETLEGYFDVDNGQRVGFENVLSEALDAVGKGVAIGEIEYANGRDRVFIRDVKFKPQSLFSFGDGAAAAYSTFGYFAQTGPLRVRPGIYGDGISSDAPLPARKFFVHTFRPKQGNRWGQPIDRKVFWASWFKRASVKQWLRFLEKGPGSIVARYNDGAADDEQSKALAAAQAINEESAVALPKKFITDVLQHVRQSMGSAYREMVDDFCNNEIARVILGQTLTSRGGEGGAGARSLGEVHERVAGRKAAVDAKSLMLAVNTQLVWPLVLFNFGPIPQPPIWTIDYEPGADLEGLSTVLQRLWEMGLQIKKEYVYQTFQLPETSEGDDVLPGPSSKVAPAPDNPTPMTSFSEAEKKKLDRPGMTPEKLPNSRRERFARLRPSMIRFSED